MKHTLKWFINRVGKTIYRKKLSCPCSSCQKTEGKVCNKAHAEYIFLCQNELGIEYQDKPIGEKE